MIFKVGEKVLVKDSGKIGKVVALGCVKEWVSKNIPIEFKDEENCYVFIKKDNLEKINYLFIYFLIIKIIANKF